MIRWLATAALVASSGCERAEPLGAYRIDLDAPTVGVRSAFDMRTEVEVIASDRTERIGKSHLAYTVTVLEVQNERAVAARVVIDEDVHLFDSMPSDRLVGPYVVRGNADGTVTATREDQQPLGSLESEMFADWNLGVSPAERAELHRRVYRTGDKLVPTALEFRTLGLGKLDDHRDLELTVTAASPESMSFVASYERPKSNLDAAFRGKVSKGHTKLSGDLQFRSSDGKPWRRVHVELRGDELAPTSPRSR